MSDIIVSQIYDESFVIANKLMKNDENIIATKMQISEKIKRARIAAGLTQDEIAEKLGISRSTYQYWEERTPSFSKIMKVANLLNLNLDELLRENDENIVSHGTTGESHVSFIEQRRARKNADDPYLVPFVDVPAQAGYTKAYQQSDYIATLKKYPILPDVDPTGAIWRYFQIEGDSMEPEFLSGDVILASQVPKEDWTEFKNLHTYVVVTDEHLWIKDVDRAAFPDKWILLSQNDHYKPFTVSVSDVRQLWVMRRHIKARAKKHKMYDLDQIRKNLK